RRVTGADETAAGVGARLVRRRPTALGTGHDVGTVRSGRVGPAWPSGGVLPVVLVAVVLVSVALIASAPDLAQAVSAAVLVAVIALEVVIFHRRRRRIAERPPARSAEATSPLLLVVAVVATSAFLAGRTAGPLCDPTSPVQFHGLWHLVTAALAGLWWRVASGRSPSG
ncbi:MAG: hypothetical protein S0880_09995, partial [Actinomycetota bacterium]|nr:hypothetical protein [Actinomycetota bacterium]